MPSRPGKDLIFIVAYNAETTIAKVFAGRISPEIFALRLRILYRRHSADRTFEISMECRRSNPHLISPSCTIPTTRATAEQKIGYQYAIDHGFDVVASCTATASTRRSCSRR